MTLNDLVLANGGTGFIVSSLAKPGRKFRVEARLTTGKYAITRLDNRETFLVLGDQDRYALDTTPVVVANPRIQEIELELANLETQQDAICDRQVELQEELEGLTE